MRLLILICLLCATTASADPWGDASLEERFIQFFLGCIACLYSGISTLALLYNKFREGWLLTFMCRAGLLLYSISLLSSGSYILAGFRAFFSGAGKEGDSSFLLIAYLLILGVGIFTNIRYLRLVGKGV